MLRLRELTLSVALLGCVLFLAHERLPLAHAQTIQPPQLQLPAGLPGLVPTGSLMAFAGTTAPAGFQICGGHAVSRTTYARLFAVIGTTYGAGDGSTTFNLPDFRGRAAFGRDEMGGTAAGRLSSMGALGSSGGAEQQTLTVDQMPAHSHAITDQQHGHSGTLIDGTVDMLRVTGGFITGSYDGVITSTGENPRYDGSQSHVRAGGVSITQAYSGITGTNATGGGQPLSTVPPAIAINYLIKD